jgi:hypothetical protein
MDVVEHADEWCVGRDAFEEPADRAGDLFLRRDILLAEQRADAPLTGRVERDLGQLLHDLHDRPVRDAFAVRQAAPAHDAHVAVRPEELGGEPRLADTRSAENGEELTGAVGDGQVQRVVEPA